MSNSDRSGSDLLHHGFLKLFKSNLKQAQLKPSFQLQNLMNCSLCRFCSKLCQFSHESNKHTPKNMKDGEHSSEEASSATENSQEAGEIQEKEAPVEDQEQGPGVQVSSEEAPGQGEAEVRSSEAECEEASPGQHNSSGYASDGSGEPGLQCGEQGPAVGQPGVSLQSDPHQSAFRPAGLPAQYPGMEPQAPEFQFRQNGGAGHGWGPGPEEMAAQGYGPPMGMMAGPGPHPGAALTGHPGMHTPIARRPITGNMSGYPGPPQAGYRPGPAHYPTSPGAGHAPHNNTYRQAPAFNGGQMPGAGWGSPSWSGSGPPSGPPPISMTPPPLSWNQAPARRHNYQGGNKPFGNIQYGGQVMQQNPIRSKNYPFPSKALNPGKFKVIMSVSS